MFATIIEPDLEGYHIVMDYGEGGNKSISVDFLRLSKGEDIERVFMSEEAVWVILEGEAKWEVSDGLSAVFKRDSAFDELPKAVYLAPESIMKVVSLSPTTEFAILRSRVETKDVHPSMIVESKRVREVRRDEYGVSYLLREVISEDFPASRLLVAETVIEYPNWGDFPPTKFEEGERLSLFRIRGKGFGLFYSYSGEEFDEKEAVVIQDYSVIFDNGYRSFAPSPNSAIYCLWGLVSTNRKVAEIFEEIA